jgi:hypothetical protein
VNNEDIVDALGKIGDSRAVGCLIETHADGRDAGGVAPSGRRTSYPRQAMTYSRFQGLFRQLNWQKLGRIK